MESKLWNFRREATDAVLLESDRRERGEGEGK